MQTRRGTVLGKRGYHESSSPALPATRTVCEQLQTPDSSPNPKRSRTSISLEDDGSNKENIPPFKDIQISGDVTPPRRALRRTATEVTPTRSNSRPAVRRSTSVSSVSPATPSKEIADLAISTPPPTPPAKLLPLHVHTRALLRSTCNNSEIQVSGREAERTTIFDFLAPFIDGNSTSHDKIQSSMFISGAPGTGKTALVNAMIRRLSVDHPEVRVIAINCMALKDLDALWERMIEEFRDASNKRSLGKKSKSRDIVNSMLNALNMKCILVLDELDHITPNEQSLSSIFTLTELLPSTLRLIGIANTHTLTSNASLAAHVQTVHFAPYTPAELLEILQSRLLCLSNGDSSNITPDIHKFLPKSTLTLLTKKVAALTGDVRCLFEVLRSAIDAAVGSASANKLSDENPLNVPLPAVTPQHVLAAFKAYAPASAMSKSSTMIVSSTSATGSNNEVLIKIHNLGLQARIVLLAILLASKRLEAGLSLSASAQSSHKKAASPIKRSHSMPNPSTCSGVGIDTNSLHAYYSLVLSRTESGLFEPVSRSEFGDLLGVLEGVGLVSMSSAAAGALKGRRAFNRSGSFGASLAKSGEVRLVEGVWGDEVLRCLGVTGQGGSLADPREEEVRTIWDKEKSRLSKDIKAVAASASKNVNLNVFSGAFKY